MTKKSVWETLSRIDVSEYTEEKNGFTYLSWAWAWSTLKDAYPDATYVKHTFRHKGDNGLYTVPFMTDPVTGCAYVQVSVTAGGETQTEVYPVLDHANKPVREPTAFHINTALQRGMAKAISMLGLGSYIYAGEDLPPMPSQVEVATPDGESKPAEGAEMIAKVFRDLLPLATSTDSLVDFYKKNTRPLGVVKEKDGELYAALMADFSKRKAELADTKEGTDA